MKRVLYSKITGKTISLAIYRILSCMLAGISMLMIILHCCLMEIDILVCFIGAVVILFTISVCILTSNRMFFGIDENSFLVMNALGFVKKRMDFDDFTCLAVVGAAFDCIAPGGNKRLGYTDKNGRFIYLPYLLMYEDRDTIKREGNDARSYVRQGYGFTIIQANIKVFLAILNNTNCPIYFDEQIIRDHYNLYELCQKWFARERIKLLTND